MKMAIIGGSGFFGSCLGRIAAREGWEVVSYDSFIDEGVGNSNISFKAADITRDEISLPAGTTAVVYLAQSPYYHTFPEHADHLFSVNVVGAIKTAIAAHGQGCRFFCFASTGSVYQKSFLPLSETSPVQRSNHYVLSKLTSEETLHLFPRDKMQSMCVRLFGLFGPRQRTMLPSILHSKVQRREPIVLHPKSADDRDPEGLTLSFCFVEDAARSIIRLAERALSGNPVPEIVNLAGPEPVSIKRFSSVMGEILGERPVFEISGVLRDFDLIADISLLKSIIQTEFTPFTEAMVKSYGAQT